MNTPIEVLEMAFPVRVERYEINPGLAAAPAAIAAAAARSRVWRMLDGADATGALCMERMTSPPFGLLGGKAGAAAVVTLTTPDGADAPPAEQGRVRRAGGLGHRHDHAGLGRLRPGRPSAIRPPSAATCSTAM